MIGASGSGKTWISSAFGINACMERYRVQYTRLPDLFQEIEEAKIQGCYKKYMKKLSKVDLLILDEFLLSIPLSEVHAICYRSPHNPLKKSIFFKS